jgi:4-hydroxy-tetrahydrodipicolinate synthase
LLTILRFSIGIELNQQSGGTHVTKRPVGIIAATPTPIKENLTVDQDRLALHLVRLLDLGCNGINLLGTTGEATSLSVAARIETMRAVQAAGLPVDRFLVGTGAAAMADAVTLTAVACELGFGGALLLPPFYYKGIDTQGLVTYVTEIIRRVSHANLGLYLYHFPALSGVPWTLEAIHELKARFPAELRGLKDSSGDLAYSTQVATDLEDFDVFPSAEGALISPQGKIFAGCISATVNVTAPLASTGWRSDDAAKRATELGAAAQVREAFTSVPLIAGIKQTLAELYSDAAWRRTIPPLRSLSIDESAKLTTALSATPFQRVQSSFSMLG